MIKLASGWEEEIFLVIGDDDSRKAQKIKDFLLTELKTYIDDGCEL